MSETPTKSAEPSRRGMPRGGPLYLLGLAILLILAALLVPREWIESVATLFDTPEAQTDSFDTIVQKIDAALASGETVPVTRAEFGAYEHLVAARRLARVGRMSAEEVRRAGEIYRDFERRLADEKGSKDAVRSLRNRRLDEALPRVSEDAIERAMAELRDEIESARFKQENAPAGTPGRAKAEATATASGDCSSCHLQLRDLPADATVDLDHLWPALDHERLGGGQKLPDMMSAAETEDCTSCHAPHGAPEFGITPEERAANVGLWMHVYQYDELIQVQVKVQNLEAPHRVPAGDLRRAYVVAVRAEDESGEPLEPWWGLRLPTHLEPISTLGFYLGRLPLDASGSFTTDRSEVVGYRDDQRLEPGRFYDEYFLFRSPESGSVQAEAELLYLPDAASTRGRSIQLSRDTITLR